jgi:4-amino-4-deoxychorismate lyase
MFLVNGQSCNEININDRGLHYGDGLFETIAIQNSKPLCCSEHLNRIQQGCIRLNIPVPDKKVLIDEVSSLIKSVDRGVIKIIITRGQGGRGYALPNNAEPSRIISLHPWPEYSNETYSNGINVRICDYRYAKNPALAGIKHLNRLEQVLARSEWADDSIAEGIVMDQKSNVIEGTMSNLFCFFGDTLCTPDLSACGIDGIIRNKIIELASDLKIDIEIKEVSFELLNNADEVFVCNSIIGVWPVKMINKKIFPVAEKTKQIIQVLQEHHCISSPC